jgi:acetyltransferase-like isoleucine patch superfamily enzyme
VWIGANTVILDGAIIKTGCIVGACSLIREETKPYSVYAGNPLRFLRELIEKTWP